MVSSALTPVIDEMSVLPGAAVCPAIDKEGKIRASDSKAKLSKIFEKNVLIMFPSSLKVRKNLLRIRDSPSILVSPASAVIIMLSAPAMVVVPPPGRRPKTAVKRYKHGE
ncbi:MAG: hypothetical protein P4L42_16950 [Desulfocapsaceae bacterium]|nr:hypothetical protein [Desulfocapsaceae bacterium]